jgi:hypothetical protein
VKLSLDILEAKVREGQMFILTRKTVPSHFERSREIYYYFSSDKYESENRRNASGTGRSSVAKVGKSRCDVRAGAARRPYH